MSEIMIWLSALALSIMTYNAFVILMFKTGAINQTRDEQGALKKTLGFKSIFIIGLVLVSFVGWIYLFDAVMISSHKAHFLQILLYNFVFVMMMALYDAFVIDLLVIGVIRPQILNLPETMNMTEMQKHVKKQFSVGWLFILPIVIISTFVYMMLR